MNEPTDEAYEKPALTRSTVETATGRELDVLAEMVYGLRRRCEATSTQDPETDAELRARIRLMFATRPGTPMGHRPQCSQRIGEDRICLLQWTDEPGWRRWDMEDGQHPDLAVGVILCPFHAKQEADFAMAQKDRAELDWWRNQFAPRFPEGQLPKPGTALIGRRFDLREVKPEPAMVRVKGPTFSCGIDFGLDQSKTILTVLRDGQLVASCEIDNRALVLEVMHKAGGAFRLFTEELVRHMEHLFHFAAGTDLVAKLSDKMLEGSIDKPAKVSMLLCVGNCGKSVTARVGEIAWVCSECVAIRESAPPRAPGEVRAGDVWVNVKTGTRMEVHSSVAKSYAESQSLWNVVVDHAQVTTSMTTEFITQADHVLGAVKKRPPAQDAPPAAAPTPVVEAAPCCRIGGEKHKERQPCPFHDLAAKPSLPPWAPEWDRFGFAKP